MPATAENDEWPRGTIGLSLAILFVFLCEHVAGLTNRPVVAALRCGALDRDAVFGAHEVWRLVTAAFVHFPLGTSSSAAGQTGLMLPHVLLNGWALIQLGAFIESVWGTARLLVVFLLSAIGCSLGSAWFSASVSGGASGGVFGLLGFLIAARLWSAPDVRALVKDTFGGQLVFWAGLAIIVGASGVLPIDQAGHLGGLATGFVLGAILRDTGAPGPALTLAARLILLATTAAFLAALNLGEATARLESSFEDAYVASLEPEPDRAAIGRSLDACLAARGGSIEQVTGTSHGRAFGLVAAAIAAIRTDEALRIAETAAPRLAPPWPDVLRATAHLVRGDPAGAQAELAPVRSRLTPAERVELALFFERQGWSGTALSLLESALAEKHDDALVVNALAWTLLTAKDERFREPRRGLELARKAVELAPEHAEELDTLAEAEHQAGLEADATEHEKRALDLARRSRNERLVAELEGRLKKMTKD